MSEELCQESFYFKDGDYGFLTPGPASGYFYATVTENQVATFHGTKRAMKEEYALRVLESLGFSKEHLRFKSPSSFHLKNPFLESSDWTLENELDSEPPTESLEPKETPHDSIGYVYFIQGVDGGAIKIGWAYNASKRLSQLQSFSPVKLRIIGTIATKSRTDEAALHRQFRNIRLHGEWFSPNQELLDFIAQETEVME